MTHHHPANVASPPRKSKRMQAKEKPEAVPFDVIGAAEEYVTQNPDDLELSASVKLSSAPSFVLAAFDGFYERHAKQGDEWLPTGLLVSLLIEHGLDQLQEETVIDEYRERRHEAVAGDLHPRSKVRLRQWLKTCSYKPPSTYGGVEDYWFRCWTDLNTRLTGAAKELGVKKSDLGVACLSVALAEQVDDQDEQGAMREIYEALVEEIGRRHEELKSRFDDYQQERKKEKLKEARKKEARKRMVRQAAKGRKKP